MMDKGAYEALTSLATMTQNLLLNYLIMRSIGTIGMAIMAVSVNVMMIALIFINGTTETLMPIAGTLFGEKDIAGIRYAFRRASVLLLCACITLMACFMLFPKSVGALFGIASAEGHAVLIPALRMFSLYIPLFALNQLILTMYSVTGHSKRANALSFIQGLFFTNGFALLYAFINSDLIWLCYASASATTLAVLLLSAFRTLKKNGWLQTVLLLPPQTSFVKWESSVSAEERSATILSQGILDFCREADVNPRLANRMAVSVEEMLVNTAEFNQDAAPVSVDVMLCISDAELLLRIRDDGAPFNPGQLEAVASLLHERTDLACKLSNTMQYSHQLGFNTTVLSFQRSKQL